MTVLFDSEIEAVAGGVWISTPTQPTPLPAPAEDPIGVPGSIIDQLFNPQYYPVIQD
ncbi:hypothetical protein [Erythrobacter insulae]|uniref:hypothetical protein n=1 Tax=Erythrobacter insulae TaxID=2584124 RepID=UPI00163D9F56|nr:hypothetical protein [Erythrobacter insulae]